MKYAQPGDIVEVDGRRFRAQAVQSRDSALDSCRGCAVIGSPLCSKMPECTVIGRPEIIYKDALEATE